MTESGDNGQVPLRVLSLFSGLGGLDLGLMRAGHQIVAGCESWDAAVRILEDRFHGVDIHHDVRTFVPNDGYDVLAAGFPCTDISHAGARAGINGESSGLVEHVFRIAEATNPTWILLENVPNLLTLHAGSGMRLITGRLEGLGYSWAYRTVDSRFTGVPQRRPRVIILAAKGLDPAAHLLTEDVGPGPKHHGRSTIGPSGFYWTEGRTGLGLVRGAIPTLKGGSTLGLPSAPAVWYPESEPGRRFVLPTVEDGEALQGLPRGWSAPARRDGEPDLRWKLVGNAVTVGVAQWVGERIGLERTSLATVADGLPLERDKRWPTAGWGDAKQAWQSSASQFPRRSAVAPLESFVLPDSAPALSHRATAGFLKRLDESGRQVPLRFYSDLEEHLAATRPRLKPRKSWASSDGTRRRMQAQRQRNTKPELALRRTLHARGLRYRLQFRPDKSLRVRVDIAFVGPRVAVDVRGCFWHRCPIHRTFPKANAERWAAKLDRNAERDLATEAALAELGWHVEVVWEHEDPLQAADRIERIVRERTGHKPAA